MGLRGQLAERLPLNREPIDFKLGYMEQAGAAFQLAARDTAMVQLMKKFRRMQLEQEDSPLIQPDQANELVPGLPRPFENPVKLSVLQDIQAEHDLRTTLERKITLGPEGVKSSATQLSASLLAHAMDPIEFAAGALMTPAVGAMGSRMISASVAGKLPIAAGRIGVALARSDRLTFTRLATEGIAGNLLAEPLIYAGTLEDHQDANIYNSAVSVIGGGLGFAAAIKGLSVLPEFISRFGAMNVENHTRAATAQLNGGKKLSVNKMTENVVQEAMEGAPRADMPSQVLKSRVDKAELDMNYKHTGYDAETMRTRSPSEAFVRTKQRRWFIPVSNKSPMIKPGFTLNPGKNLGKGITLTDNPLIANGMASHSSLKAEGSLHEVSMDKIHHITDLDNNYVLRRSPERRNFEKGLKDMGFNKTEIAYVVKNEPTWMEALERVGELKRQDKLKGVQFIEPLEDKVVDLIPGSALKYEMNTTLGIKHQPQNAIFIKQSELERLYQSEKTPFTKVNQYDADASFNKKLTEEQYNELAADYKNPQTDRYYDKTAVTDYETRALNPTEDPKVNEIEEIFQENKKVIKKLAETEDLTKEELEIVDRIEEIEASHQKELEISQDAYNCQLGV